MRISKETGSPLLPDTSAAPCPAPPTSPRRLGRRIYFILFGAILFLMGLALTYGGSRLVALDDTPYYLVAGLVTVVAGILIARQRRTGFWLIAALTCGSLVWALTEVGFDGWALVPRLNWLIVISLVLAASVRLIGYPSHVARAGRLSAALAIPAVASLAAILVPIALPAGIVAPSAALTAARPVTPFSRSAVPSPDNNVAGNHDETNWTAYAGSNLSNHYSPAAQITSANVAKLKVAWEYHTKDLPEPGSKIQYLNENTPLKVGNSLFVCTPTQRVIALDATTGKERWQFDPKADRKALKTAGAYCRGVAYYQAPTNVTTDCPTRILWGVTGGRLAAVNAETGASCKDFGESGFVDLKKGIGNFTPGYFGNTSAPVVIRGKVVIGHMVRDGQDRYAPSGVVRAYDAISGKFAWAWDIGRPGNTSEPGPNEQYTPGTPNVWAPISADDELGLVYLPTGNASGDFWAAQRTPLEEEYTSSIVAVEAATGKVRWHFRTVNHDVWDFDIGPQPNLVDWPTAHGTRPAVIQATKSGQIFVLDRETGAPLMPVHQMPAPQGGDAGDRMARTQPISPGMPMTIGAPGFKPETLDATDAWGISPFDQMACRIQFNESSYEGMWTPPMLSRPTIQYPGSHGGINWGGVSVDTQRGLMVFNSNRLPYIGQLLSREQVDEAGSRSLNQGGPDKKLMPQVGLPVGAIKSPWLSKLNVPCLAPPWGHITAVDLRTHQVVWQRPFGTGYDTGPLGIPSHLKVEMGTPSDSGPLTTAGGVTFIGATLDRFMRAFDTTSGEQLWETRVPAGPQGSPLTYMSDGKQYVVAVVGGHQRLGTTLGDSVIAWTLP